MTSTQKTLLIIGGIIVLLVAVANISDNKAEITKETLKEPGSTKILEKNEMEDVITDYAKTVDWEHLEEQYMLGCNGDGGAEGFCQCGFNIIKKNYTKEEYLKLSLDLIQTGEMPNELMLEMMEECEKYYN